LKSASFEFGKSSFRDWWTELDYAIAMRTDGEDFQGPFSLSRI
jgi:hypothetical protein